MDIIGNITEIVSEHLQKPQIILGNLQSENENLDDLLARFYISHEVIVHPKYLGELGNYGPDLIEITQIVEIDEWLWPYHFKLEQFISI